MRRIIEVKSCKSCPYYYTVIRVRFSDIQDCNDRCLAANKAIEDLAKIPKWCKLETIRDFNNREQAAIAKIECGFF